MFTVTRHPLRRQHHAVTGVMPASSQNVLRLVIGLLSLVKCDVVFMPDEKVWAHVVWAEE